RGGIGNGKSLPVCLSKPTLKRAHRWSIRITFGLMHRRSFDDLIGELLELRWHIEADCRGSFDVDHEIEPLRTLYRQLAWLDTVQNLADIFPASSKHLAYVWSISYEAAVFWKFAEQGNQGKPFGQRKIAD